MRLSFVFIILPLLMLSTNIYGVQVSVSELSAVPGSAITVEIIVDDVAGIVGGDIGLEYDSAVLKATAARVTDLFSGLYIVASITFPGRVTFAMAGMSGLPGGSGAILEIDFDVKADASGVSPLTLSYVLLFGEKGVDIDVTIVHGRIIVTNIGFDSNEELMRKYEPFLFFHKEDVYKELFYPMDVESYLSKCSIWHEGQGSRQSEEGTVDTELLATLGRTKNDSDKLYLKFVEEYSSLYLWPLEPKDYYWYYTIDELLEYLNASPQYTYYYRQFIEPDFGYLVLQYWFFYAFNSWGADPLGYNIHEGDWESIMLFLHPVTETPVYVAYSAHHDEGEKVRKTWDEIRKTGTYPRVFVALGSHANYFEPKFDILTEVLTGEVPESAGGPFFDRANGSGMIIGPLKQEGAYDWEEWENRVILEDETHSLPDWARLYDGKWGMDALIDKFGFSGPRFPPFQNNSDTWYHPAIWAGIEEGPAAEPPPPVTTARIEIEGADTVWETNLTRSEGLAAMAQAVQPRIIVEYADYNAKWDLVESTELKEAAVSVSPRVIVEYADSCFSDDLQKSESLESLATVVPPRIIVEYADSCLSLNLVRYIQGGILERTLSITSAEVPAGSSATVHLSITDVAGVSGGDVLIKYDASVITIDEVTGTDLISGINLMANIDVLGQIKIGMAGTQGLPSGSGDLVDIELTVNADAQVGAETTLSFGDTEIYDETGTVIPVALEDSTIKVADPIGIKGDVNGDGKVRSNDAILTLRIATDLMTPTDDQKWAADMNGDGKVRSNDAILILRKAAGLAAPVKGLIADAGGHITITLAEAHAIAGESVTVPLKVDDIAGLASGDVSIAYDSSVLRAVDVSSDSDMLLEGNIAESGMIRIAFASANGLDSKTLARIRFDVLADDVSPLAFRNVELYNLNALPLTTICIDKKFSSWAVPPEHSALLQNFPNPFNPDTWIPYQLREADEVTIQIFSVSGDMIRELQLGNRPAGLYVNRDRAAYWDGRNTAGEKVASGIYFYSIQAGDFAAVRKLIVLK